MTTKNTVQKSWTPNRIVLVARETECKCGEKYRTPDRVLLERIDLNTGSTYLDSEFTFDEHYASFKRVVTEYRNKVEFCEKCINDTVSTRSYLNPIAVRQEKGFYSLPRADFGHKPKDPKPKKIIKPATMDDLENLF